MTASVVDASQALDTRASTTDALVLNALDARVSFIDASDLGACLMRCIAVRLARYDRVQADVGLDKEAADSQGDDEIVFDDYLNSLQLQSIVDGTLQTTSKVLKENCEKHNLKTGGSKIVLARRLLKALVKNAPLSNAPGE